MARLILWYGINFSTERGTSAWNFRMVLWGLIIKEKLGRGFFSFFCTFSEKNCFYSLCNEFNLYVNKTIIIKNYK